MIDGLSAQWQEERGQSQMTLGGLIHAFEAMRPDQIIPGFSHPHSYRGYYCDLAFERGPDQMYAGDAVKLCRSAMGEVFTGYKGGEFQMGRKTPVWMASDGHCGDKIIAVHASGALVTQPDEH